MTEKTTHDPKYPETIAAEVTFHIKVDDVRLAELRIKARGIDDDNGADPPESYTLEQAFQVVWHQEPEWLHENVICGWTLDAVDTGEGYKHLWIKEN